MGEQDQKDADLNKLQKRTVEVMIWRRLAVVAAIAPVLGGFSGWAVMALGESSLDSKIDEANSLIEQPKTAITGHGLGEWPYAIICTYTISDKTVEGFFAIQTEDSSMDDMTYRQVTNLGGTQYFRDVVFSIKDKAVKRTDGQSAVFVDCGKNTRLDDIIGTRRSLHFLVIPNQPARK